MQDSQKPASMKHKAVYNLRCNDIALQLWKPCLGVIATKLL